VKEFGGWQLPDHEEHLIGWMRKVNDVAEGRQRYQGKKQVAAIKWCRQFRTAVDIGGHVGLWSYYLASKFSRVHAFEPVTAHRECFAVNVTSENVTLHGCALGERAGSVSMKTAPTSSGDSFVGGHSMLAQVDGAGDIPMRRLDEFELQDVDFIKVDCEGYELFILRGAEETLRRCRPCVIVEQKPGHAQKFGLPETEAVDYLQSLGAKLRVRMSGDFILSWDN
jgi:FkbM family methyltransferase